MKYCLLITLTISLLTSCGLRKKVVYFQAGSVDSLECITNYTPTIKTDDLLSIIVTAEDANSVAPFNLPVSNLSSGMNNGYSMGNPERTGYLVDVNGNISLPIIGELKVAGMDRVEVTNLIVGKIKDYVNNPLVQIQILNYKVTVLGDVKSPGTFKIPNERISILEAIGLAGDLNITGDRKNVLVLRDENGSKKEYRVDLTDKKMLASPVFYLSQNDVVYIEPNKAARSNSSIWRTSGSIFVSTAALIITTINVILK